MGFYFFFSLFMCRAYRENKLAQLKPVVIDEPKRFAPGKVDVMITPEPRSRVAPKNPRLEIGGETLDDISDFFNSSEYAPVEKNEDEKPAGNSFTCPFHDKLLHCNRTIKRLIQH
jgi:hypothetical protein